MAVTDHPTPVPVAEVLGALWPDGATVSLVRGVRALRGRRSGDGVASSHLLLPSARRARLVVPAGPAAVTGAALAGGPSDGAWQARAVRRVLGRVGATGLLAALPLDRLVVTCGVRSVTDGAEGIEGWLSDLLGEPVVVAVSLGSDRANRKPVLRAVRPADGTTAAWVKVGDGPTTAALVDREAAALAVVGAGTGSVRAPAVLHHGTWAGLRLLVLSTLGTRNRRGRQVPVAAMASLAERERDRTTLATSPFWARLVAGAADGGRVEAILARLAARAGDVEVDLGWGHGDWAPWNMAWDGATVDLWDWERFEASAPVGADAVHHRLHGEVRRTGDWDGALTAAVADAPVLVRGSGSTTAPDLVVDLYLADLAVRYAEAAAGPRGAAIADASAWVASTLERRLA